MSAVDDIRVKLEARLRELEAEIESLRGALDAIDSSNGESRSSGSGGHGRRRAPGPSEPDRTARSETAEVDVERLLAETGGMSAVELARHTGTDYAAVLARIRELESAGRGRA